MSYSIRIDKKRFWILNREGNDGLYKVLLQRRTTKNDGTKTKEGLFTARFRISLPEELIGKKLRLIAEIMEKNEVNQT